MAAAWQWGRQISAEAGPVVPAPRGCNGSHRGCGPLLLVGHVGAVALGCWQDCRLVAMAAEAVGPGIPIYVLWVLGLCHSLQSPPKEDSTDPPKLCTLQSQVGEAPNWGTHCSGQQLPCPEHTNGLPSISPPKGRCPPTLTSTHTLSHTFTHLHFHPHPSPAHRHVGSSSLGRILISGTLHFPFL